MKKKWIAGLLALAMAFSLANLTTPAFADSQRVVTLGADLTDAQRTSILKYFGILNDDGVQKLTITNQDERDHLASYIPLEQIGTRTFSCAYVCPTRSGGIRVKTANLSYVTSNMIATTLSTSGIVNCDVVAASPIKVSGTGALTGVIMAYEAASGETLDASRKELAAQELTTTEKIADEIGQVQATEIINDIKIQIIENEIDDDEVAEMIVDDILAELDERRAEQEEDANESIALSQEERDMLVDLAQQIAAQKYDYEDMKATLERVEENVKNLEGGDTIINNDNSVTNNDNSVTNNDNSVTNNDNSITVIDISADADEENGDSILDSVDDSALGEDVISDSTNKEDNLLVPEEPEPVAEDTGDNSDQEELGIPDAEFEEFGDGENEEIAAAPIEDYDEADDAEITGQDEEVVMPEEEPAVSVVEEDADVEPEEPEEDMTLQAEAETEEPAAEASALPAEAYISSDETLGGIVKINIAKDDVQPVSGTLVIQADGEDEGVRIDLADVSRWSANPLDEEVMTSRGWDEGTVLTVLTGQDSEQDLIRAKKITADLILEDVYGQQYAVQTGAELPAPVFGAILSLGGSQDLFSGRDIAVTLYSSDPAGTAQIAVNDSMVCAVDRETVSFADGENGFTLSLLEEGVASVTVTFLTSGGEEMGRTVITLPVEAEH